MRNPLTGDRATIVSPEQPENSAARGDEESGSRRIPLRLAAAAAGVVLLLTVLVVSSLDSSPGEHQPPATRNGGDQPWWAGDVGPESASPTAQPDSDTYLIVGPETGSPSTSPSPSRAAAPPAQPDNNRPPSGATFTAVAGDGCPHDGTRGYAEVGRYTDGTRGWYSRSSGGWTGNGCSGSFDALPMSGSATRDATSAFVVWWFKPANFRQGTCEISVYVPTGNDFQDVAGSPAFYNMFVRERDWVRTAGFSIEQIQARGSWVSAGSYPLRDGQITVQMVTRGENPNGEHLAAAQVRASCRGA
jgi:translation initiation factor IF-2